MSNSSISSADKINTARTMLLQMQNDVQKLKDMSSQIQAVFTAYSGHFHQWAGSNTTAPNVSIDGTLGNMVASVERIIILLSVILPKSRSNSAKQADVSPVQLSEADALKLFQEFEAKVTELIRGLPTIPVTQSAIWQQFTTHTHRFALLSTTAPVNLPTLPPVPRVWEGFKNYPLLSAPNLDQLVTRIAEIQELMPRLVQEYGQCCDWMAQFRTIYNNHIHQYARLNTTRPTTQA